MIKFYTDGSFSVEYPRDVIARIVTLVAVADAARR